MTTFGRWAALAAMLGLAGCGGVNLNPFTWFGGAPGEEVRTLETVDLGSRADPRPLVVQVTSLAVEPVPGGIIVRATGLPPTQGFYDAGLSSDGPPEDGALSLALRAAQPPVPQAVSTAQSREVVVAYYLSERELDGVRVIRVRGGRNALTARR